MIKVITGVRRCGKSYLLNTIFYELPQNKFCLGVGFHPDEECGEVLNDGVPKEDVCSYDTSLKFFQTLVEYAADGAITPATQARLAVPMIPEDT